MTAVEQCKHIKDDGERCMTRFGLSEETGMCFQHDPDRALQAHRARSRGGQVNAIKNAKVTRRTASAKEVPPPPESLEDATKFASWAVWAVATGLIDSKTGRDCGYILRAFMDGRKNLDRADEKVKAIEKELARLRKATG